MRKGDKEMIFKSITLNNFRQYRGENVINFSIDSERNVTVVLGVNTSGKTTLVQSFLWCLYGVSSFKTKEILNSELANSLAPNTETNASVKIVLVHDGKEYTIERSQTFTKGSFDSLRSFPPKLTINYKDDIGNTQWVPDSEKAKTEVINSILSKDLSDYFFFDGERIEEISDKKNVVDAVRGLMGIDILGAAIDHLDPKTSRANSVIGKLRKELDVGSDNRGAELKRRQEALTKKLQGDEFRLTTVKSEIKTFEAERVRYQKLLLDTKEVASKQKERLQIEANIKNLESNINTFRSRLLDDFNRDYFAFFATPLIKRGLDVLASAKDDPQGIPKMHSDSIDYILERKRCICGCDLSKNQGAIDNILYERKLLPPQHIGTDINTLKTSGLQYCRQAEGMDDRIIQDYKEIVRLTRSLDDARDDLKLLSEEIKKLGEVNIRKIEEDYQANERLLSDKLRLSGSIERDISDTKRQIDDCIRELNGLAVKNDKNDLIRLMIKYAEEVYNWFKETYDQLEQEVREQLTDSINRIFKEMYHGSRKIEVDSNYRIKLKTDIGEKQITTDESKGLEAVKNFSFISGLVDLARNKARQNENDDVSISTEPYPIVMDAPFSNVDEIHIGNISTILPNTAEQVILIVMKKDWEYAREKMLDKVGASYIIEKVNNSETFSKIRRNEDV